MFEEVKAKLVANKKSIGPCTKTLKHSIFVFVVSGLERVKVRLRIRDGYAYVYSYRYATGNKKCNISECSRFSRDR